MIDTRYFMERCKFKQRLDLIAKEFKKCKKVLLAIGDDTRQAIILALLESDCDGIRVGEIRNKTHLSRPAVSHHLKILKEAGIVNMRREGTKNYYYMDANETQWKQLSSLVNNIYDVVKEFAPEDKRHIGE